MPCIKSCYQPAEDWKTAKRIREPDSLEISCFSDSYAAFKALKSIVN